MTSDEDLKQIRGWAAVAGYLESALHLSKTLTARHRWNSYIDDVDCQSALVEMIQSAESEISAVVYGH